VDGLDEAGPPGVVVERAPQLRDRLAQRARGDGEVTPDVGEQLFLGDERRRVDDQIREDVKGVGGEFVVCPGSLLVS
jgi:hypothetical protein